MLFRLAMTVVISCFPLLGCGGCAGESGPSTDVGESDGSLSDAGSQDVAVRADGSIGDAANGRDGAQDFGVGTPGEPWVDVTPSGRAPTDSRFPEMVYDEARQQVVLVTEAQTWVWAEDIWIKVADGPPPANRERFSMAYDQVREEVVLFGGWTQRTLDLYGDTWTWDGTSWTEQAPAASPEATFDHEMAYDASSQQVILYGGGGQAGLPRYEDTWAWNGDTWTLLESAAGTGPLAALDMVFDSERGIAVLYGSDGPGVAGIWEFDGAVWTRADEGAAGPSLRNSPALLYDPTRQATLLVSGYTGAEYLRDTWSWDGQTWTDVTDEVGEIYKGRFDHAAAFDGAAGEPIFFGGYGLPDVIGTTLFDETFVLRDGDWLDVSPDASPPPIYGNGMAYDAKRREVVLYGGAAAGGGRGYRSTWAWDGRFWRRRDTGGLPGQRFLPAMAFDPVREEVVLYGGAVSGPDDETYTWDGAEWTLADTGSGPTGPGYPQMVWDAAREQMLLHSLQSTWTWEGEGWTRVADQTTGMAGTGAMAFDPVRDAPVLIGSAFKQDGGVTTTAWVWDGVTWVIIEATDSPMAARNFSAAFWDPVRDSIVVFAGSSERSVPYGDTLELSDDVWRDLTPEVGPTERQQHGMAYDQSRRRGVMFGGVGTSGRTWEWNGAAALVAD